MWCSEWQTFFQPTNEKLRQWWAGKIVLRYLLLKTNFAEGFLHSRQDPVGRYSTKTFPWIVERLWQIQILRITELYFFEKILGSWKYTNLNFSHVLFEHMVNFILNSGAFLLQWQSMNLLPQNWDRNFKASLRWLTTNHQKTANSGHMNNFLLKNCEMLFKTFLSLMSRDELYVKHLYLEETFALPEKNYGQQRKLLSQCIFVVELF